MSPKSNNLLYLYQYLIASCLEFQTCTVRYHGLLSWNLYSSFVLPTGHYILPCIPDLYLQIPWVTSIEFILQFSNTNWTSILTWLPDLFLQIPWLLPWNLYSSLVLPTVHCILPRISYLYLQIPWVTSLEFILQFSSSNWTLYGLNLNFPSAVTVFC